MRFRELAAYLASEGLRLSESQIIKAALLLAQPDRRVVKAYLDVKGADQRYKQEPEEQQVGSEVPRLHGHRSSLIPRQQGPRTI